MKIAFGSDHAGVEGRRAAMTAAAARGLEIVDVGPSDKESVDYADYAHRVAEAVTAGKADLGVLVCGTGQGMAMAANRHPHIRAAVITDELTAQLARAHNDANVACFGERVVGPHRIAELLSVFLDTKFEGGRHARRVEKIEVETTRNA